MLIPTIHEIAGGARFPPFTVKLFLAIARMGLTFYPARYESMIFGMVGTWSRDCFSGLRDGSPRVSWWVIIIKIVS